MFSLGFCAIFLMNKNQSYKIDGEYVDNSSQSHGVKLLPFAPYQFMKMYGINKNLWPFLI